jgi:hypothetical protein
MARGARNSAPTSVRELHEVGDLTGCASVVSLHAHTHHSRESITDVPQYVVQIPLLGKRLERELRACVDSDGQAFDLSKGWWHPPVSARDVFESEAAQIERRFGLAALVSITDHDDITAGLELQRLYANCRAPISFEWTVPHGQGFFHLGIHNLPPATAKAWFVRLASIAAQPLADDVFAALDDLCAIEDVLVVFNHPMWDLACVGADEHRRALRTFLDEYGSRLHALELNGYRSWKENVSVRPLANATGLPLISGGDRHGTEPNALLNLTAAESFAEFVAEIRRGISHLVVMPEYRRHLTTRILSSTADVLRRYRSYPAGRQHWTDRVSCDLAGSVRPLSSRWPHGGPLLVRSAIRAINVVTSPVVWPVVRAAFELTDSVVTRGWSPPPSSKTSADVEGVC